jgi:hypothetical protein
VKPDGVPPAPPAGPKADPPLPDAPPLTAAELDEELVSLDERFDEVLGLDLDLALAFFVRVVEGASPSVTEEADSWSPA